MYTSVCSVEQLPLLLLRVDTGQSAIKQSRLPFTMFCNILLSMHIIFYDILLEQLSKKVISLLVAPLARFEKMKSESTTCTFMRIMSSHQLSCLPIKLQATECRSSQKYPGICHVLVTYRARTQYKFAILFKLKGFI